MAVDKEESVRKLFALVKNKRKEWAQAARAARVAEFHEEAEEEGEEEGEGQDEDEGGEDEDHDDRSDSEPKPDTSKDPANGEDDENDEGEEEAGDDEAEDPVVDVPSAPSSSCHMNLKRERLSRMMNEIASLEKALGESLN